MADSARRDVELRVRAVLEGGGTLREAREEVRRWSDEMRRQVDRYRELNKAREDSIKLAREEQGVAGRRGPGQTLFGLRPYELQNLSYQLNDVVTQLASGANATQVFAQQGGQVLQLFSRNLFAIIPRLPQIAAGIGLITVAVQTLNSSLRQITAEREFGVLLRTVGNGANYTAKELAALERQIYRIGFSYEEARKIIQSSVQAGVAQERIPQIATIARDIAAVRPGQDATKIAADLAQALADGVPALIKWNEQLNLLDENQLKLIRDTRTVAGDQAALAKALELISTRTKDAADQSTLFGRETRELRTAWDKFIESLEKTGPVQRVIENIRTIIGEITNLINALTRLSTTAEQNKILQTLEQVIGLAGWLNPAIAGRRIGRALFGVSTGAAPDPFGTGWQGPAQAQQAGALGMATFVNRLKVDTEELRQGIEALQEATRRAGLPAGYRVEVISTERPGARVAGTGEPSEHGAGRAIDVRIVDEQGRPIPGSMGLRPRGTDVTGYYARLDAAFEAFMKERYPAQLYSIGTRFQREPDPGHYGVGRGAEQIAQAAREGRPIPGGAVTTPLGAQRDLAKETLQIDRDRYAVQYNLNELAAKAARQRQAEREADAEKLQGKEREEFIERRLREFENQRRETIRRHDQEIANQRLTDGKNAAAIDAAGAAARAKAIQDAQGLLSIEQANTAEMQGREEARKRFGIEEAARQAERRLNDQIDAAVRGGQLKDLQTLDSRLDEIRIKYRRIREEIARQREEFAAKGRPLADITEARLEPGERREIAGATAQFYLEQAQRAQQQRQALIAAVQASRAAGGMTIAEAEEATKAAFDATAEAINKAADELAKFIATSKDLDPSQILLLTAKIKEMRAEAQYISPLWKTIRETFEQSFSTGISNAMNTISEALGGLIAKTKTWADVWKSVRTAAMQFFAQLLKDIASAIISSEAKKIASSLFGAATGGGGGGFFGFLGSLFGGGGGSAATAAATTNLASANTLGAFAPGLFHQGGVVGRGGASRLAPGWWFAGAPRYHNGTLVGLAPNEQAAILKRGEEVLSVDNPRNIMNGGGRGAEIAIRNVLVDDPSRIPEAMAGAVGERVIVQTLIKNAATVRELVKG